MAKVGEPKREIYIEPLELPEPLRESPAEKPERVNEPERVPAHEERYGFQR